MDKGFVGKPPEFARKVRLPPDRLSADLAVLRAELAQAHATITNVRAALSDTQAALQQHALEAERLAQQVRDLTERQPVVSGRMQRPL